MKNWIKKIVYKLMGNSRREIIAVLERREEQLLNEIISLKKQTAQLQISICNQIDTVAEAVCQKLMEDGSPLRVELFYLQQLLRQEAAATRHHLTEERNSAEHRLLEDGSPLRFEFYQIQQILASYRQEQARLEQQLHIHMELAAQDTLVALSGLEIAGNPLYREKQYELQTDYPVAYESPDHLHPWGTKNDNTRAPFFIQKCESLFPEKRQLRFADLGCAGGGIVLDALLRGHQSIGLEGSDYSLKNQRAEWRLLRNNLFTCDIAKRFYIQDTEGKPVLFDIVSAWEVLEHIPEEGVSQLLDNISNMLTPGGYFVGTVSQVEDFEPESGMALHVTIRPVEWWYAQFEKVGLERADDVFERRDLARGWGNPPLPWLLNWGREESPELVVRKPIITSI